MSHITTFETKIRLKDQSMINTALENMRNQFSGMTFEQTESDVIKVRYAPIEVYQRNGNLQFVKNEAGIWEMQFDTWNCEEQMYQVRDAFFVQYQQAAVESYLSMNGYMTTTERDGKNTILTAVKY